MSRSNSEKLSMVPVESSNVKAVGYLPAERKLRVEFHSGGLYEYLNVEGNRHKKFMEAESKGAYLGKFIKGKYKCRQILAEKVNLTDTSRKSLTVEAILDTAQARHFPLLTALLKTKTMIKAGQSFPYCLWAACGREDTKIHQPGKETKYAQCLRLMMEAAGEIGKAHVDATISLARKKRV